jgi:hypothetical protein
MFTIRKDFNRFVRTSLLGREFFGIFERVDFDFWRVDIFDNFNNKYAPLSCFYPQKYSNYCQMKRTEMGNTQVLLVITQ